VTSAVGQMFKSAPSNETWNLDAATVLPTWHATFRRALQQAIWRRAVTSDTGEKYSYTFVCILDSFLILWHGAFASTERPSGSKDSDVGATRKCLACFGISPAHGWQCSTNDSHSLSHSVLAGCFSHGKTSLPDMHSAAAWPPSSQTVLVMSSFVLSAYFWRTSALTFTTPYCLSKDHITAAHII